MKTIVLKRQIFMRKLDCHGLAADLRRLGLHRIYIRVRLDLLVSARAWAVLLAKTALMAVAQASMRIFAGGRLCEWSAEMHVDFRGVSFRQRSAFSVFLIDSPG